jgi:hypothetical protein
MPETRAVKDLALGEIVHVDGLEGEQVVRSAKKIRKGPEAGWLELTLVAPDGDTDRIALDPEGQVTVVGKDPGAGKGKSGGKKAKGKARANAKSEPDAVAASATPAPRAEAKKKSRGQKKAQGQKKMSCLDAAAKLLTETGQPMTCPNLIEAMAAKVYWSSPAGKTPALVEGHDSSSQVNPDA